MTASLQARVERLEGARCSGVLLFSWKMTGAGKAYTDIDGQRHAQKQGEGREEFLARIQSLAAKGRTPFVWVSEEDAKL